MLLWILKASFLIQISVIQQSNILEVYHLQLTLELKHLR